MSVVVWIIRGQVDAGSDDGSLVSVDGIEPKEEEHLLCNLARAKARTLLPLAEEAQVRRPRAELVNLAENSLL